jgi:hypothetical protein
MICKLFFVASRFFCPAICVKTRKNMNLKEFCLFMANLNKQTFYID